MTTTAISFQEAKAIFQQELQLAQEKFQSRFLNNNVSNYRLEHTSRKSVMGFCDYGRKVVGISDVCLAQGREKLINTLKHEIAHCLCPKEGHNHVWKCVFMQLGGSGETTTSRASLSNLEALYKWKVVNTNTGEAVAYYARKPSRDFSQCTYNNDKTTLGKLVLHKIK